MGAGGVVSSGGQGAGGQGTGGEEGVWRVEAVGHLKAAARQG